MGRHSRWHRLHGDAGAEHGRIRYQTRKNRNADVRDLCAIIASSWFGRRGPRSLAERHPLNIKKLRAVSDELINTNP